MKKYSNNKYLKSEHNSISKDTKDINMIKVNRADLITYNSPKSNIRKKRLLSENNVNTCRNAESKPFIFKKTTIEKLNSLYKDKNLMTIRNNHKNISLFFVSPKRNLETINNNKSNFSTYRKKIKIKKKYEPMCQLYYTSTNKSNKMPNDGFLTNRKNNSYFDNIFVNLKKDNIIQNKNPINQTKLINSSSSTALSFSESNKNLYNNFKNTINSTINNNHHISHFSIDYSLDKKTFVYKKTIISPNMDKNIINNKMENQPLFTFGNNNISENKTLTVTRNLSLINGSMPKSQSLKNRNSKYIIRLKNENEFLKNQLIKTNEKIFLLESKIENLIEGKIRDAHTKSNLYTYKKNIINNNCPKPTPYVQKFSQTDFFVKEKSKKITKKSKEKIKPVIDRIFRCFSKREEKNKNNKNIKSKKIDNTNKENLDNNIHNVVKEKITIKRKKNKFFHEFKNQINDNIIT